ncbi:hypothetical protein COCNU_10G008520 [Cocos nucifera]|uniref:DUF4378 domain-containing protein n=1 Tax=Cocos nucifera TaxID=13894 RepID=A0A8K0N8I8_COCNU|nr:hypothetical protein COCNU_10G008520 [Cocos nucifera]
MGKRSYKHSAQAEKDNAGCMWGLINMFDFRRGRSGQKLLSDRKRGSARRAGIRYSRSGVDSSKEKQEIEDDFDEEKEGMVNLGMPSVKVLMEEEMSKAHSPKKIPSDEVEQILSDLGHNVHPEKKHEKRSKNQKENSYLHVHDLNAPASLDCNMNSMARSLNFDLATFFTEFYGYDDGCEERHADCKIMIDSSPSLKADDLGKHYHHDEPDSQIEQKKSILQKALGRVAEAILNQKLVEAKELAGNKAAQSEEFINALEILNSDKELLLKLLQDPNSVLLKHIQDIQNAQIGKQFQIKSGQNLEGSELLEEEIGSSVECEESASNKSFHKRSTHKFFRNKDQSKGTDQSSQDLNRIVVLKPSPARTQNPSIIIGSSSSPQSHHSLSRQEDGQRVISHFSLKEIKRRLRHLIGESKRDHHVVSMDAVLHKIPYGSKDSGDAGKQIAEESEVTSLASETSCNTDNSSQSSAISKKTDKKTRPKECKINVKSDITFRRVGSFFYEEAKKHLAEMLHTRDQINNLPSKHGSKSLGRILTLPEYHLLSPRDSPASDKELDLSPKQTRLSPSRQFKQEDAASHLSPSRLNSASTECNGSNQVDETQVLESNPELTDTQMHEENCIGEALNPKDIVLVADASLEGCNHMVELSESCSTETIAIGERFNEGLELGSLLEKPQPTTPSVSILPSSDESISEKLDRPSPVSVLEPFFSDDAVSPAGTIVEKSNLLIQPQELHFGEHDSSSVVLTSSNSEVHQRFHLDDKEARFEYIKAILETSGLSMDELLKGWNLNDQFLEPSLFDEVGTSYVQLQNNPKLLFDCINEVLMEMQERFFRFTPRVSFIKPNIRPVPIGGDFIQEVSKGIDWHPHVQFPSTLDQILQKDLDAGTWINLWFETEDICIEIEDTLLDDLLEETVYEFWFEP